MCFKKNRLRKYNLHGERRLLCVQCLEYKKKQDFCRSEVREVHLVFVCWAESAGLWVECLETYKITSMTSPRVAPKLKKNLIVWFC